mgnify:CR=1 FL=1
MRLDALRMRMPLPTVVIPWNPWNHMLAVIRPGLRDAGRQGEWP